MVVRVQVVPDYDQDQQASNVCQMQDQPFIIPSATAFLHVQSHLANTELMI
jgi:hypothetical protein